MLNSPNGTISSPKYPQDYYSNANCTYLITTDPGKILTLEFDDFRLEELQIGSSRYLYVITLL